jgi:2-dehydropantoate 2-reductase
MKIAVVGIGGVGGYYGALLARHYSDNKDIEIVFIARGKHLEEIKANGLQLLSDKESFTVRPDKATDDPSGCGTFELILFCVKSYDLEESTKLLAPHIDDNTTIISLLNGVDNAERLKSILRKGKILNGCVYIGAHILRPGVIRQVGGSCKLFFGNESDEIIDGKSFENTLRAASIEAEYRKDIRNIVWEKYLFISPFANATTFINKTMRELLDNAEGKALLEGLLQEVVNIAKAKRVKIPENIMEATIRKASAFPYETKTSMQMDFEKDKKAEIETFTGYIVKEGRKHQIAVPNHELVYEALQKRGNRFRHLT